MCIQIINVFYYSVLIIIDVSSNLFYDRLQNIWKYHENP